MRHVVVLQVAEFDPGAAIDRSRSVAVAVVIIGHDKLGGVVVVGILHTAQHRRSVGLIRHLNADLARVAADPFSRCHINILTTPTARTRCVRNERTPEKRTAPRAIATAGVRHHAHCWLRITLRHIDLDRQVGHINIGDGALIVGNWVVIDGEAIDLNVLRIAHSCEAIGRM